MNNEFKYRVIDFLATEELGRVIVCRTQKYAKKMANFVRVCWYLERKKTCLKYHKLLKTYVIYSEREENGKD